MTTLGITEELLNGTPAPAPKTDAAPPSLGVADELIRGPELRAGPGPQDKSQIADIADDPNRAVPTLTLLRAGFFPDDNKKLDYLAQETGIPRERWGVVDGNIVYADPKTNRYVRAVPSVMKGTNPIDLWHRGTQWLADNLVPSAPAAAGGAVGALMGPTPASILAAGGVAGATDLARSAIGDAMLDGEQSWSDIEWLNALGQAGMGAVGQALPTGIIRGASRNPMKISPYERKAAMNPETLAAARQASAEAEAQGIPLSFGQSTGLKSALAGERQLAKDPASMDTMQVFYDRQRELLGDAVRRKADEFSPVQSVDEGVGRMREGARDIFQQENAARTAAAAPYYEEAMKKDFVQSDEIKALMQRPSMKQALNRAYRIAAEEGRDPNALGLAINEAGDVTFETAPSMQTLDYVKKGLDDVLNQFRDKTTGKLVLDEQGRAIDATRRNFLAEIDKINPEYAAARKVYADMSPDIERLKKGGVGSIAKGDGVEKISEIRNLFNANLTNPGEISKARMAYEKAGRGDDWNAGLATWLRDALDASTKTNKGGAVSARDLVSSVYRDENQKKLLRAAMTSEQFDGFTRLMNVVQNIARTMPEGSPTATDTAGMAALREQFGSKMKMGQKLLNMQIGDAIFDRATLRLSDSGMAKLAEAVTAPQNVEQLKKLRMLDPRSEKAALVFGQMAGVIGTGATGAKDARGAPPKQGQQEP